MLSHEFELERGNVLNYYRSFERTKRVLVGGALLGLLLAGATLTKCSKQLYEPAVRCLDEVCAQVEDSISSLVNYTR